MLENIVRILSLQKKDPLRINLERGASSEGASPNSVRLLSHGTLDFGRIASSMAGK
jgi:hypothetical protein